AVDDAVATDEDVPVTIAVLVNDSDPDYDDLILEEATQGEHGTTDINPEGTITYTPAADFYGSDSFEYAISDGNGGTSSATVTLTVRAVNDAPVADDQSISTEEDTPVALTLTGSDIDSPPPLDFQVLSEPTHGQLSGTAPDLTYTPDADYHGLDNFTFQVSDGDLTDEGTVTLTITAANDPPVAVDNAAATDEDIPVTIAVLDNDSDPDNDDLTLEEATQGEHGTTDINPDSTITYSPAADFYGSDSFEYTISDGNGGTASATVTLTVRAVNDAPVAQNDSYTGTEDIPLSVSAPGVLANDSDVDQEPLSAALASPPASGELELHADGSFDYTPADGFNGTVTFQYQAVDEDQAMSNVATVTLAIGAVNDPPIADALSVTTDEDQSIDFTLTGSDPEDDPLTFTVDENPSHGALSGTPPDLTYLPAPDYYGPDAFTFTADDGHGGSASATVSLTVQAVNDAPVAQNDNYSGTEDIPLTVNAPGVLANDSDVDQEILSAALASPPTSGELDFHEDGSFTYTPEQGFNGSVTFQYQAVDEAQAESNVATVTLAIGAVNDPPIAARDEAFTESNTPVTIDVLLNDTDPDGDALTVVGTTTPVHGSVLINPGGTLTYTPDVDFSGSDGFSYEISDGMGGLASAQVVVFVNISGITEGMSVGSEGGTVTSDAGALIDIPAGALDSDVEIQIGEFTDPPAGADVAGPMFFFGPSGTQFSVEVTITVPYDPELVPEGFDESELVLLLYNEYDGTWEALPSSVNTIAHTITGVTTHFSGFVAGIAPNHAPVVLQSLPNKSIEEDTPYATLIPSLTEYFFDQDEGDQLTFSATALEDGLDTLLIGQYLDLIAIPSENFFGKVHIVVLATDRRALFASDTLLLTVAPVNDAPQFVAIIPDFHIYEDHAAPPIPLWAEDVEGDQLTYSAISDTVAVAVTITDTILHAVPAPNWHGSARILVSVSDGQATQVDTFNLTVEALNDAPSAFDLFEPADASVIYIQPENIGDSLTFAWDDALDPDGDPVTYTFTLLDSNTVQWEYAGLTSHEVKVSYADIVAAIRDQDLMLATFWWTIVAISGQDTVQAAQGPFQLTIDTGTLAVADQGALPQFFVMHQNYPNPFNPITTLKYELPAHSRVLLVIYDMRGREVTRLVDGYVPAGYNKVVWNSSDAAGRPVPSGVYFARLVTSEYTHTIKMTLVR
ncbi:MAG: tandem-95 repeat protein, partial [Fidelibacterota bacterium]